MKKTNRFTNIALCILLTTLSIVFGCKNMTEPPVLTEDQAVVSVTVSNSKGRTVLPSVDIAKYRLLGGKAGADEVRLGEEFTTGTTTVTLEAVTWNFTLEAYNTAGELVLRGKVPNKKLEADGNNQVVFELDPLMTGTGSAHITIHFPDYVGITKVTATGDLPEESSEKEIEAGEGTYIWEKNDVNAGYYFVSFTLYKDAEPVSVVSEMVLVGTGLSSKKVISLSGNDLKPSLYTIAEGASLIDKLNWLDTNAESGGNYLVEVTKDESIASRVLGYTGKSDISITLIGLEVVRTVTLDSDGSMFTVGDGITLALGSNITLQGSSKYSNNMGSLVRITDGGIGDAGRFILENGAVITGNTAPSSGGGVYMSEGTFTMNGGSIKENSGSNVYVAGGTFTMHGGTITDSDGPRGGGVYVAGGTFTMDGGEITENEVSTGGGVYVASGTFAMDGGAITRNTAATLGGGVYVLGGTFTMSGGAITGNTAESTSGGGGGVYVAGGTFTMDGGAITGNTVYWYDGGGVYVRAEGIFTMHDGVITENTAPRMGGGVFVAGGTSSSMDGGAITGNTVTGIDGTGSNVNNSFGGGVMVYSGTFTMDGGEIMGNMTSSIGAISNGGGVYVYRNGTFTMDGGVITRNTASSSSNSGSSYGGGVYVDGGTFTMDSGAITENTASSIAITGSSSGGGVFVYGGTFTMADGEITGNTASCNTSSSGGGVYVENGTFTMNGGEIMKNTASSSDSSFGGGVFVNDKGTFTKTSGIITGYTDDPVDGNVVKYSSGSVQQYRGHAVLVYSSPVKGKETTVGAEMALSYNYNGGSPTWSGEWN